MKFLAEGDCYKEIAVRLGVSYGSIRKTLSNLVQYLEAKSVMEVLATALRGGWIA